MLPYVCNLNNVLKCPDIKFATHFGQCNEIFMRNGDASCVIFPGLLHGKMLIEPPPQSSIPNPLTPLVPFGMSLFAFCLAHLSLDPQTHSP